MEVIKKLYTPSFNEFLNRIGCLSVGYAVRGFQLSGEACSLFLRRYGGDFFTGRVAF